MLFTRSRTLSKHDGSRTSRRERSYQPRLEGLEVRTVPSFAAATHFELIAPEQVRAGQPAPIAIIALDASNHQVFDYHGTVHITSSDPSAVLPADFTFNNVRPHDDDGGDDQGDDRGTTVFHVTFNTPGMQTITATDVNDSSITGTVSTTVNAAPVATHFAIIAPPVTKQGVSTPIAVVALDASNHLVTNYTGTVHFTSSDGSATLPSDITFSSSNHGIVFTHVTFNTTGPQTITATDTANSSLTATSDSIDVLSSTTTAAATQFVVLTPPRVLQGVPFPIIVAAVDANGRLDTSYTGTVHFTSSDGSATLPSDFTFTSSNHGIAVLEATLNTTGTATITASDSTNSLTGTSRTINVQAPMVTSTFKIIGPHKVAANQSFQIAVIAVNADGSLNTGYTGTVHFTSSDSGATLPSDYTFTSSDNGIHVFTITLAAKGPQTITVTDTSNPSITSTFNVNTRHRMMVTGADAGGTPEVREFDLDTGKIVQDFFAYDPRFRGGVRVAMGDINGDGVPDIITVPGAGGLPDVRVFDGVTGKLIKEFLAFSPNFLGGVNLAVADFNHDGFDDIVTGADAGGGPHVEIWSGKSGGLLSSFFALNPLFHGGVRLAEGDVNGDGTPDLIVGAGAGGAPQVEVFSGLNFGLLRSFLALDGRFSGGVTVAADDTSGKGHANIIVGADAGGAPQVEVFDGLNLGLLQSFFAFDPRFLGGVRVSTVDFDNNGTADLVAAPGHNGVPLVRILNQELKALDSFFAYDQRFLGGIFVGSGD